MAVGVGALFGVVAAWWTPRGPVSAGQALLTMSLSFLVGWVAALVMRSRWAVLVTPVGFGVAFEIARIGAEGPTVDGLHLTSVYGLLAAASGRGVHGLLVVAPMVLGAVVGVAAVRRLVMVIATVCLVLLALVLARPASTPPIVGPDGEPLPGSVAELTAVDANDHDLSLMIRGTDTANPVLLFLAGGPGGTELGAMRKHGQALESDFVVATLDQRGTGRSYGAIEPTSTLSLSHAVDDVIDVTDYLRDRFEQDQIYLVGQSWGTTLGVLAARQSPEKYAAFVGVGQMVSQRETDLIFYEDTLAWARSNDNAGLERELEAIGPPPYDDLLNYPTVLGYEQEVYPYDHSVNSEGAGQMLENLPVGEYSAMDTVNIVRGLLDTFAIMYPQLQDIDFRTDVTRLEVPVYLVQGRYEARGRAELAAEWFRLLEAPSKKWIEFETSGHRPLFEQPEEFAEVMSDKVLAETTEPR